MGGERSRYLRSSLSLEGDLVVGDLELGLSDDVGKVDSEAAANATSERRGRWEEGGEEGKEGQLRAQRSSFSGRKKLVESIETEYVLDDVL